jgi:hypothetical protein
MTLLRRMAANRSVTPIRHLEHTNVATSGPTARARNRHSSQQPAWRREHLSDSLCSGTEAQLRMRTQHAALAALVS